LHAVVQPIPYPPNGLSVCYSLAVAGNRRATWSLYCVYPRWGREENRKKKEAKNWWVRIRAV